MAFAATTASPVRDPAGLETLLELLVAKVASEHPGLTVSPEAFVRYLAERLPEEPEIPVALESLQTADLYLACACVHGDRSGLAVFDPILRDAVQRALERQSAAAEPIAEITQVLRERLLLGTERDAGLVSYAGRGPLSAWLRAVAVRTYLNSLRDKRELPEENLDQLIDPTRDPEAAYVRSTNAGAFKQAFYDAVATLSDRDKNILRYFYVDSLSLDEIAKLVGSSRATAHRWLATARTRVVETTQEKLRQLLGSDAGSLPSLRRLVLSDLDITMQRLFG